MGATGAKQARATPLPASRPALPAPREAPRGAPHHPVTPHARTPPRQCPPRSTRLTRNTPTPPPAPKAEIVAHVLKMVAEDIAVYNEDLEGTQMRNLLSALTASLPDVLGFLYKSLESNYGALAAPGGAMVRYATAIASRRNPCSEVWLARVCSSGCSRLPGSIATCAPAAPLRKKQTPPSPGPLRLLTPPRSLGPLLAQAPDAAARTSAVTAALSAAAVYMEWAPLTAVARCGCEESTLNPLSSSS